MTYILRCATEEARPTEPSASLAEVQRTEKDKRTFSLHCSFLTPLLYNEEKASMEVPDAGNRIWAISKMQTNQNNVDLREDCGLVVHLHWSPFCIRKTRQYVLL